MRGRKKGSNLVHSNRPIQSLSRDVRLCVCVSVPLFALKKSCLITLIYKCCKSNLFAKRFLRKKFRKDIGLRFSNCGSEMVKNGHAKKSFFFGLRHSLLMDLGHNQQQHPTVHSGGVSRVPCCSPAPPLPLTFRSPSVFCGNFLWTL